MSYHSSFSYCSLLFLATDVSLNATPHSDVGDYVHTLFFSQATQNFAAVRIFEIN